MELTGKILEHMDRIPNVKKMKNFLQQKKQFDNFKKTD